MVQQERKKESVVIYIIISTHVVIAYMLVPWEIIEVTGCNSRSLFVVVLSTQSVNMLLLTFRK